jgi:hypothetical protein
MAYVIQEDILASIDATINVKQGESQEYSIALYRDRLENPLTAERASSITVAVVNREGKKVLMFANPQIPGVTQPLIVGSAKTQDLGIITFEITESISRFLEPGDLNVIVSISYADFYPNAKTYVLPVLKIGQIIEGDAGSGTGGDTGGNGDGTVVSVSPTKPFGSPEFTIEHIDLDIPSASGRMSVNNQNPYQITEIIFRNLDKNLVRLTSLENFVVNRMGNDKIEGILTIYSIDSPSFYTIYKILGWERIDLVEGNGDSDNTDGIKLKVLIEDTTTGPGVTKDLWQVGDNIAFSIDTHGITGENIKPEGILTYKDKHKKVTVSTDGASSPTGVHITYSPYYDSYVMVEVNGISVDLGNNTKDATCYFSGNNGISPVAYDEIREGDQLIWNGNIAGFELEEGDEINLIYEVDVDTLR